MRIVFLLLALSAVASAAGPFVYLTVSYCPTLATNAGAVVRVDPISGKWDVVNKFKWNNTDIFGCVADYGPSVFTDRSAGLQFLSFPDAFGYMTVLDLASGRVVQQITPTDPFFDGFENFFVDKQNASSPTVLAGFDPAATQGGVCSDGCFNYAKLTLPAGTYENISTVPYKAVMDDTLHTTSKSVFLQASYPLSSAAACSDDAPQLCLVNLNRDTGDIIYTHPTNFTVYKYGNAQQGTSKVLGWVEGFDSTCKHPYNDFAFAEVDLADPPTAKLLACIPKTVTVDTDEWISSFATDDSLFATGSGDSETGEVQLLVLKPSSGDLVLQSRLTGLPQALGAAQNLIWIWGLEVI